jgi:simple sugar transport system ATP-binding protein
MVGREVVFTVNKEPRPPGPVVLALKDVRAENDKGIAALKDVSFELHSGEILGIAGEAGNGQSELAQVITGLRPCQGSIRINGREIGNAPPIQAIEQGVAHIPEDRHHVGSAPNLSITDNTIMKGYRRPPVAAGWTINAGLARSHAQKLKDSYDILAPNVDIAAGKLSGGNLQKVILAREISTGPKLMVAVQPTRGLDVGAIEAIQKLLLNQREAGAAILLISEELEELLALSDRLAVIYDGRIMGIMPTEEADIDQVGLLMTGGQ